MKHFLHQLRLTPEFLGAIFVFAYLESIQSRIGPGQVLSWYVFTPEAAISAILNFLLIILILRICFRQFYGSIYFPLRKLKALKSFWIGLGIYLIITNLLGASLALLFDTWDRNFTFDLILTNNFSRILSFIVYGGFYLAFLLFQEYKNHQEKLSTYELAFAETKFSQLKQQLNPHFLFNNLNILDQLIEDNPKAASDFLNYFSELYRYVLEKSDVKLVDWTEEVNFAKSYFKLMGEKYGKAYQLEFRLEEPKGKIPPLTLQLLLENAIIHNFGTETEPVFIRIEIGKMLRVSNRRIPFKQPRHRGGRSLENLREQFSMLSAEP